MVLGYEFGSLTADPCRPGGNSPYAGVQRGAVYEIHGQNPDDVEKGVRAICGDRKEADTIPAHLLGRSRRVETAERAESLISAWQELLDL